MRLPINPLLYLISAGLLAGSGLLFQQTLAARKSRAPSEIKAEAEKAVASGQALEPEGQSDRYGANERPFWMGFNQVNLIGKLPPPPPSEVEAKPPAETSAPIVPVSELLTVLLSVSTDEAPANFNFVIVRYKPTAGVEPPPDPVAAPTAYAGPGDATAPPGPSAVARGPAPYQQDPNLRLMHTLRLEETLWPPHQNLRLIKIDPSGESVVFLREDPTKDRSEWQEERVFKDSLEIGQEVLRKLAAAGALSPGQAAALQQRAQSQEPPPFTGDGAVVAWVDDPNGLTFERAPDQFHIGSKDQQMLNQDFQQVLEKVGVTDYTSRSGSIRGVQVGRVPSDLHRFGIQDGDVLVSVNGEPTPNRSIAIKVGKEQYRRGARQFRVKVLRGGRDVELTYVSPK